MPDLSQLIRERRRQLGLTQAELGRRVGRAPSTIGSWEAGRSEPPADVLETLTHVLDLDAIEDGSAGPTPFDLPEFPLRDADDPADTGPREPLTGPETSTPVEETHMQESATVVVAKNRRAGARVARRLEGQATVVTPDSVRTDVDALYRTRAVATAVLVGVLAVVFVWAIGEASEALSSIVDALFAPWR